MTDLLRSTRLRATALALAAAAGWLTLGASPAQAQATAARVNRSGDFIVAVVNTELVTAVEVNQRLERALAEARRAGATVPPRETLRQQVLDSLIDERVLITHARDSGARVDDAELDRAVANIAAQNQLTVPQLRDRLKTEGMAYSRFRDNLRDQLIVERLREREVAARIRIDDGEIDRLLDDQRGKAAADIELNIAQVLVTVPEGASDAVVAERRAKAQAALARIQAGEPFAKVAAEVSEDGKREAGGEIGLRPASRLPDLFVDAVKGLAVGQVTPAPLRSAAGFHVLKLVDRQEANAFKVTQTHARHILLRLTDREQTAAVVRRMEQLRAQIERKEKSFEAIAREVSEDGTAESGGDLGWVGPGNFVPEFEDAMNKLPLGGLSTPVVSRFGVHLIQVMERRDVTPELKEIRDQARNQLREIKYEPAYLDWVKELRLRAYIELREAPL
jgi:peptidyl-prolyl cis-trans isomerase SurA